MMQSHENDKLIVSIIYNNKLICSVALMLIVNCSIIVGFLHMGIFSVDVIIMCV